MVSTNSLQDRAAKVRQDALQQYCIMAGDVQDSGACHTLMREARTFVATVEDAEQLAGSFNIFAGGKNLVAMLFVQDGKVTDTESALAIAELIDTDERWGGDARQSLKTVVAPWLNVDDSMDLGEINGVLKLAHKLDVPSAVHRKLGEAAGTAIASNFDTADELVAHLEGVSCGDARNAALVAYAQGRQEDEDNPISLKEGFDLLGAVADTRENGAAKTRVALQNTMIPGLQAESVTYDDLLKYASLLTTASDQDDDSAPAEEAFVVASAPHITTVAQAIMAANHFQLKTGTHRVLSAFVERCGLPNAEGALAITMAVKSPTFGDNELLGQVAAVCRKQGFDFDPYAYYQAQGSASPLQFGRRVMAISGSGAEALAPLFAALAAARHGRRG